VDYDIHFRPLWDWALDMLSDHHLAPLFVWDAQRLSKFNGDSFVRFFHEPWTANRMWEIQVSWRIVSLGTSTLHQACVQSQLPAGGKPFCFILYADKTNLSSFGTKKGYPVMARCGNLPVGIRNGKGIGGGRVVGWLPIVGFISDPTLIYDIGELTGRRRGERGRK
jgi:Plavaka transposase